MKILYKEHEEKDLLRINKEELEMVNIKPNKMQSVSGMIIIKNIMENDIYEIRNKKSGCPYILNSNVKISISHTENLAIGVVSDYDVGVDLEEIERIDNELINFINSKEEINLFGKLSYQTFVIKEAIVKMIISKLGENNLEQLIDLDLKDIKIINKNDKIINFKFLKQYWNANIKEGYIEKKNKMHYYCAVELKI